MFKFITCEQAKKMLKEEVNLFDVRDEKSFAEGHIENAKYLSSNNFDEIACSCCKTTPTIVYCYRGNRSKFVAKLLAEQGFENVFSLEGGFMAWKANSP